MSKKKMTKKELFLERIKRSKKISKSSRKNRMVKSEMSVRRIGPDDPLHPDFMKGVQETAQRGLKRAKIERDIASLRSKVASSKLKAKKKQKKKPITVKQQRDRDAKFGKKYTIGSS